MLLDGKVAVVTGSSKGLGQAFVEALAKEGAGVVVNGTVAADVSAVVEGIKKAGGKAGGCVESVATMAGAERIIQSALDNFGRIDLLVNNAGVLRDRTFLKMTEEEWDTVIGIHLKGAFACSKAAARAMVPQSGGRIINVTSAAFWKGNYGQCNYAAAKGGILGLTFVMATELAEYHIGVNALAPRAITRMNRPLLERNMKRAEEEAKRTNSPVPELFDLGWGGPEMVAPLVVFLASDDAKGITGNIFWLGAEKLAVISRNQETVTATALGGWSVDLLRRRFRPLMGAAVKS